MTPGVLGGCFAPVRRGPMVRKISISLPDELHALVSGAVMTGRYGSVSEVIREALRGWTEGQPALPIAKGRLLYERL